MKISADIDIDMADRDSLLRHIRHTPAAMLNVDPPRKHNTGIYVTGVPSNSLKDMAGIDYTVAEARGYFKIDLLNVYVYGMVRDEAHLQSLMQEPDWSLLRNKAFFKKVIHIGNHYESMKAMPEPIDSIPRMAMFLAVIRPGKKHLIGKPWREVAKTIWEKNPDEDYSFKKSHSCGYAHLCIVHMNLLAESRHAANKGDTALLGSLPV